MFSPRRRSRRHRPSLLRVALPDVSTVQRAALAAHWRRLGENEHSSITAFEHLRRRLQALDAPASLIEACVTAGAHEADHARRCLELASIYAGATIEPVRIRLPRVTHPSRADLAAERLRDGVFEEGCAAWLAGRQAERASDPTVVETLRVMARDEAVHAELSWQIVAWCVETGDEQVGIALLNTAEAFGPRATPSRRAASPGAPVEHFGHGLGDVDPAGAGCRAIGATVRARVLDLLSASATTPR